MSVIFHQKILKFQTMVITFQMSIQITTKNKFLKKIILVSKKSIFFYTNVSKNY